MIRVKSSSPRRLPLAILLMSIASILGLAFQSTPQRLPSQQQGEAPKRLILEARIPPGIKLIDVRNAHLREWDKKLEVELKNESAVAIIYMEVLVAMPEIVVNGARAQYVLAYGDVGVRSGKPSPYPEPRLEPGSSAILRIDPVQRERIEDAIKITGLQTRDVTEIKFNVHRVYFADGTSYIAQKKYVRTSNPIQKNAIGNSVARLASMDPASPVFSSTNRTGEPYTVGQTLNVTIELFGRGRSRRWS